MTSKIIIYLVMGMVAVATVTSTGCYGLYDQIFIGWRDKTGCVSFSLSCFGTVEPDGWSDEGVALLVLFLALVVITYGLLVLVKKVVFKHKHGHR